MDFAPIHSLLDNNMTWYLKNIPQKAWFYWNNSNLPYVRYLTLLTFRKHNPNWQMILYTSEKQVQEDLIFPDYWSKVKDLNIEIKNILPQCIQNIDLSQTKDDYFRNVYLSDYLRWWLLNEYGGLWSDMDILYLKSMDEIRCNKWANESFTDFVLPQPYNNFLLSAGRTALSTVLWRKALEITQEQINTDPFTTGPVHYENVRGKYPTTGGEIRREEYVIPYPGMMEIPLKTTEIVDSDGFDFGKTMMAESLPPETVGIHWHGSGLFSKYTEITEENYQTDPTLLAQMIRIALDKI